MTMQYDVILCANSILFNINCQSSQLRICSQQPSMNQYLIIYSILMCKKLRFKSYYLFIGGILWVARPIMAVITCRLNGLALLIIATIVCNGCFEDMLQLAGGLCYFSPFLFLHHVYLLAILFW
jgi:hypothetical protein